jgi:ACR3 family arsenite transporter
MGVVFKGFLSPEIAQEYRAGMILLGVAPCTAMVLMWSYLARGNMEHTLVMTGGNSLSMVVLYAPLAQLLLGISGIIIPWATIAFSVAVYICLPLLCGYFTRTQAFKRRGMALFELKLISPLPSLASLQEHHSQIYRTTGGVHSAALCDTRSILVFSEDIGRHNAIDKIFF